jgi:hypothetical protein
MANRDLFRKATMMAQLNGSIRLQCDGVRNQIDGRRATAGCRSWGTKEAGVIHWECTPGEWRFPQRCMNCVREVFERGRQDERVPMYGCHERMRNRSWPKSSF